MKECPTCRRFFPDQNSFCSFDGLKLIRSVQNTDELQQGEGQRQIPPPAKPVPLRMTIIDQSDEGHRSRVIDGLALDFGKQGMRIQTGTIETGQLHIIADPTVRSKTSSRSKSICPTPRLDTPALPHGTGLKARDCFGWSEFTFEICPPLIGRLMMII